MSTMFKALLLASVCVIALTSCSSDKGPGALGTKNDIVVRNNGLPGAPVSGGPAATATEGQGVSSTVEQAAAVPAPSVDQGESLEQPSPQTVAAEQQIAEATAPVASTTNAPSNSTGAPGSSSAINNSPIDEPMTADAAPASDVPQMGAATREGETIAPPPPAPTPPPVPSANSEQAASSGQVYPQDDYGSAPSVPAQTPVPVRAEPAPAGTGEYRMKNPNAPYSPKAAAAAGVTATSVVPEPDTSMTASSVPVSGNTSALSDASSVRAAQTALKAQGNYAGPVDGSVNAAFLNALSLYQGMNKLPQGGLNTETMQSLSGGAAVPSMPETNPANVPVTPPIQSGPAANPPMRDGLPTADDTADAPYTEQAPAPDDAVMQDAM